MCIRDREVTLFEFVHALKANGFSIAVDDYGADESDIARVKALQPQIVKFDGGWLQRLMESNPGAALLKAMVKTFHDMGIKCVFEGLEETWQLEVAAQCNVDLVQGFVLARPELVPLRDEPDNDVGAVGAMESVAAAVTFARQVSSARGVRAFGRRSVLT